MTTPPRQRPSETHRSARRTSNLFWVLFIAGTVVLALLALLPVIATGIAIALWGLGGSGSNK
ncbi:MAG: hypothetical protein J2P22_09275 [Nocardioides sp.]|nr:hypothetical protein [Nocardioides sp.]